MFKITLHSKYLNSNRNPLIQQSINLTLTLKLPFNTLTHPGAPSLPHLPTKLHQQVCATCHSPPKSTSRFGSTGITYKCSNTSSLAKFINLGRSIILKSPYSSIPSPLQSGGSSWQMSIVILTPNFIRASSPPHSSNVNPFFNPSYLGPTVPGLITNLNRQQVTDPKNIWIHN